MHIPGAAKKLFPQKNSILQRIYSRKTSFLRSLSPIYKEGECRVPRGVWCGWSGGSSVYSRGIPGSLSCRGPACLSSSSRSLRSSALRYGVTWNLTSALASVSSSGRAWSRQRGSLPANESDLVANGGPLRRCYVSEASGLGRERFEWRASCLGTVARPLVSQSPRSLDEPWVRKWKRCLWPGVAVLFPSDLRGRRRSGCLRCAFWVGRSRSVWEFFAAIASLRLIGAIRRVCSRCLNWWRLPFWVSAAV